MFEGHLHVPLDMERGLLVLHPDLLLRSVHVCLGTCAACLRMASLAGGGPARAAGCRCVCLGWLLRRAYVGAWARTPRSG